jgi:hypothetical protein
VRWFDLQNNRTGGFRTLVASALALLAAGSFSLFRKNISPEGSAV